MDTTKVAELVRASFVSESTRDVAAGNYLGYTTIESFAKKQREKYRQDILAVKDTLTKINRLSLAVDKSGVADSLLLFRGREFAVTTQVRVGKSFVDMEIMRLSLSCPEDAWEAARRLATHRRDPEVLLNVARL